MLMWILRWHFTNKSVTGASNSMKLKSCSLSHTAGHNGEEYDDWNSAALRSRRNYTSDGAERTDSNGESDRAKMDYFSLSLSSL